MTPYFLYQEKKIRINKQFNTVGCWGLGVMVSWVPHPAVKGGTDELS
jgi:hypothetical protein